MTSTPASPADPPADLERGEAFMRLLLSHQQRIYGLILALVPNWTDADDIMQETTAVLWRKFDEFERGTNFSAWALKIARLQVLAFRKRERRNAARLSDELMDQVAERMVARADRPDVRRDALEACLRSLPEGDRYLIELRYEPDASVSQVAETVSRSVDAVYKALNRIHGQLLLCVRSKLSHERG